jgi:hypothetical protein
MQQFTVPQFIDVEDKIVGPITVRQFLILFSAGLLSMVLYKIFVFTVFVFLFIIILAVSSVLAFVKVNGMPFHFFMLNIASTWRKPNLRVWQPGQVREFVYEDPKSKAKKEAEKIIPRAKPISESHLSELALTVDTRGQYRGPNQE